MLGPEPHGAIADGLLATSMSTPLEPVKAAQKAKAHRPFHVSHYRSEGTLPP
jgi:hypothetical protein